MGGKKKINNWNLEGIWTKYARIKENSPSKKKKKNKKDKEYRWELYSVPLLYNYIIWWLTMEKRWDGVRGRYLVRHSPSQPLWLLTHFDECFLRQRLAPEASCIIYVPLMEIKRSISSPLWGFKKKIK